MTFRTMTEAGATMSWMTLVAVLGSCGSEPCPAGFLRDNDGNCIAQGGDDGDADADGDSDSDADADGDVVYDCACDATFEDDYYYLDETWGGNVCINPDYADLVVEDAAEDCVDYYDSLGYYNIVCYCSCDPTSQGC